jgi:hypothetical protein
MPSPFPGMDPYLEGALWTTFRFAFGAEIVRQLALRDPLPAVPIPLLPGDADVSLDLQQTFTATYDLLGYDLAIDYTRAPEPALDGAASAIADSLLRMAGLRSV